MVDDFIERKHGDRLGQHIDYLHPDLKPVLKATYGVILYQEQVMQIAQVLAGYTLGGSRPAAPCDGQEEARGNGQAALGYSLAGAERGVEETRQATHIFDLMEKFAGYGFNKSHSAAYAVLSYQTAWLKAHHPAAFMAAVMSADLDNTDHAQGRLQAARAQDCSAGRQSFCVSLQRRRREGNPLRPRCHQGCGPGTRRVTDCGARGERTVLRADRVLPAPGHRKAESPGA
jgi:DNA polymerase-3 subunit alpha